MVNIKYPWLKKYLDYFHTENLAHSQLFSGKPGIGKSYFSLELSKSLLCLNSSELFNHCGKCVSCKSFQSRTHPDFKFIQPEDENKVIKISQLRGNGKDRENKGILNFLHETPLISKIQFKIMGILRKMNEKYLKKYSSRKSIEGSIYGDMQRKRKSQ